MQKYFFPLLFTLAFAGCGQQITDYVKGDPRGITQNPQDPSTSSSQPVGIKISPGANDASGTQIKSRFAITPSQRSTQGSYIKSKFTFHQNRPE